MIKMLHDSVRFAEKLGAGRTLTKTYSTYPHRIRQVSASLSGIDYGFSDEEGLFFRSEIEVSTAIVNPYHFQVKVTFGFRSREFDKRVDATVQYNAIIDHFDDPVYQQPPGAGHRF